MIKCKDQAIYESDFTHGKASPLWRSVSSKCVEDGPSRFILRCQPVNRFTTSVAIMPTLRPRLLRNYGVSTLRQRMKLG